MRILYHHRTRAEDAQGIHIAEMVRAFRALGHDVEQAGLVQAKDGEGPAAATAESRWRRRLPGGKRVYELMSLAYNVVGYRDLAARIRRQRPDLLYERYSLNTFCGVWASRRFGVPLLLEVNAPLYHEQRELGALAFERVARFSEAWICSHSTRTIVVTAAMKQILVDEGVPADHISVMHNGIDPERFHCGVPAEEVRRRYGLAGATVIGFVGWLRKWHGLEMLVEIAREARFAERGVRLLLVGDGPALADIRRDVEAHSLQETVILTGAIPHAEVPAHIAAFDIAVQPSATPYACPMKIVEYLGMRKCIVAPDQGNIRELLQDGVTGVLFAAGDKASLRAALERAICSAEQRQQIAQRGFDSIFQRGLLWRSNAERALALVRPPAAGEVLALTATG